MNINHHNFKKYHHNTVSAHCFLCSCVHLNIINNDRNEALECVLNGFHCISASKQTFTMLYIKGENKVMEASETVSEGDP